MVAAEGEAARTSGRVGGIIAARDRFYKGDIAEEMVAFLNENGAPYTIADFAEFFARIEVPVSVDYRGYEVYKQPFNSQGPMLLQALNILENYDLRAMGHNSADYVHVIVEAMKLAYADRDTYYADQDFVDVPAEGLLSKDYARERARRINMRRSESEFVAGDPLPYDSSVDHWPFWMAGDPEPDTPLTVTAVDHPQSLKDTSHIAIIDEQGNVLSVGVGDASLPVDMFGGSSMGGGFGDVLGPTSFFGPAFPEGEMAIGSTVVWAVGAWIFDRLSDTLVEAV